MSRDPARPVLRTLRIHWKMREWVVQVARALKGRFCCVCVCVWFCLCLMVLSWPCWFCPDVFHLCSARVTNINIDIRLARCTCLGAGHPARTHWCLFGFRHIWFASFQGKEMDVPKLVCVHPFWELMRLFWSVSKGKPKGKPPCWGCPLKTNSRFRKANNQCNTAS